MTQIKICGLFRSCDIEYVNEGKPDFAGFILNFPKSHRNITAERAAELRRELLPGIRAVGVFVDQPQERILEAVDTAGLDIIQLHGHEDDEFILKLRGRTALPIWKAFKVRNAGDLAAAAQSRADEVLLDNGYGTGTAFDWSYASSFSRPFILAGGLTPENIPEAVRRLSPKVLDISSGVETDKLKDRKKILAAIRAARAVSETEK